MTLFIRIASSLKLNLTLFIIMTSLSTLNLAIKLILTLLSKSTLQDLITFNITVTSTEMITSS